uniref:Uncharacterized protein n=1 Tax=Peronospora matthiolae TaxID=2874970 RepID=A0AAV1TFE0_9STRA
MTTQACPEQCANDPDWKSQVRRMTHSLHVEPTKDEERKSEEQHDTPTSSAFLACECKRRRSNGRFFQAVDI